MADEISVVLQSVEGLYLNELHKLLFGSGQFNVEFFDKLVVGGAPDLVYVELPNGVHREYLASQWTR